jgi:hypothetical protein
MSDPHGPREESADPDRQPSPPQAGAQPPTESEPAPSAAPPPDAETAANAETAAGPPPYGIPPGHYMFVPDEHRNRGFGPAFGRFARNRATHLVAAVVVGALVGGGTVAIFDNAVNHPGDRGVQVRPGGPFDGHRFPDFRFGDGQRFGN